MLSKCSKRNAISVLAITLLCSIVAFFVVPRENVKADEGKDPIFVYDFSADSLPSGYDKTVASETGVKISATVGTGEATLYSGTTNSKPDAYVENGKLVFKQSGVSDTNGYFVVSENALGTLNNWTLSMKIGDLKVGTDNHYNLLSITQKSPLITPLGKDNQGLLVHNSTSDGYYNLILEKSEPGWVGDSTPNASFYFDDGTLDLVYDGTTVSAYISGNKSLSVTVGENYFADKSFIKIGGYILTWGRNATICSIDNVALYGYAKTDAEIKANYDKEYPVDYSPEKRAEIYYDFAEAAADGTVKNMGTATDFDGRIVAKNVNGVNDVRVENGSLVIDNEPCVDGSAAKKDAGYFRLPDEMFMGKTEWTIQMTVSEINASNQNGIIGFFEKDPTQVPIVEDTAIDSSLRYTDGVANNTASHVFWFWNSNANAWTMYAQTSYKPDGSGKSYGQGKINPFKSEPKVLTIIYKNGVLVGYCDEKVVFTTQTALGLDNNYYEKYKFNKIGGYQYSWGRSSTQMTIDDFAFYGYALNVGERVAESNAIVSAEADLGSNATDLKAIGLTRDGKTRVLTAADVTGVDFKTLGEKEYTLYFNGQYSPVKTVLLTRDIKNYAGELTVDPTDVLPSTLTVEYTDGRKGEAKVKWGDYSFKSGTQTVSGTISDDAGRTATATLTVTGIGFEWSKVEDLFAKIDAEETLNVKSSFNAFKAALADKIAALKAFENDKQNEGVTSAYSDLLTAYEAEKANLISVEPINAAIDNYSADLTQINEKYKTEYQAALAALEHCKEECASVAARDKAIEEFCAAAGELYLSLEYAGIAGAKYNEGGDLDIVFDSQPKSYWGLLAFSNEIGGDFYAEYQVNQPMEYVKGEGANVDVVVKTKKQYITYRVLKNYQWDADCITRCFNVSGWKANATSVAVEGEYPAKENGGAVWSADKFEMLNPYTVRVYRKAESETTALYFFELEQDGVIRHAFYDRVEDVTDANIGFAAQNCSVKLENVKIKGTAKPFTAIENADYYFADGTTAIATDAGYAVESGNVLYSSSTVTSTDQLYSFDVKWLGNDSDTTAAEISFGFAQKNGTVHNRVNFAFASVDGEGNNVSILHTPVYGIDVGLFGTSKAGSKENFGALEINKTYKFAVLAPKAGENKRNVKVYVLDGDDIVLESKGVTLDFGYDVIPVISAKNGSFAVSKVEAKDLGGAISCDEIDETLYSTESVAEYRKAIEGIDFGIITLINATEQELEQLRNKVAEAQKLLKLTKIIETLDEFQKIIVKQNAKKVVLPLRVKVKYDNGQTKNVLVEWVKPDTSVVGDFNVKGVILQPDGSEYHVYYPITIKAASANPSDSSSENNAGCGGCGSVLGGDFALISVCLAAGAFTFAKKKKQ